MTFFHRILQRFCRQGQRRLFGAAILLSLPSGLATAGHESNGGNLVATNFVTWGRNIQEALSQATTADGILSSAELVAFKTALDDVNVEVVDIDENLFIDSSGNPVHARTVVDLSSPGTKKIQLEKTFWESASGANPGICRLVFHEYLRVLGIHDDQSAVSWRLAMSCDYLLNSSSLNGGFEGIANLDGSPTSWQTVNESYTVSIDASRSHKGLRSARLTRVATNDAFGAMVQCIAAEPFKSKIASLIGYLRTYEVNSGWAGLWMRVDAADGRQLAFDNMAGRGVMGTLTWVPNMVELKVANDASRICFGALLIGSGTVWADDLVLSTRPSEP